MGSTRAQAPERQRAIPIIAGTLKSGEQVIVIHYQLSPAGAQTICRRMTLLSRFTSTCRSSSDIRTGEFDIVRGWWDEIIIVVSHAWCLCFFWRHLHHHDPHHYEGAGADVSGQEYNAPPSSQFLPQRSDQRRRLSHRPAWLCTVVIIVLTGYYSARQLF